MGSSTRCGSVLLVLLLLAAGCSTSTDTPVRPDRPATTSSPSGNFSGAAEATPNAGAPVPAGLRCLGREVTVVGSRGPDVLSGRRGRDVIHARGGDDVVRRLGGRDLICAGGGDDRLVSERTKWPFAYGVDLGAGDDRFRGHQVDVIGGSGDDVFLVSGPSYVTPGLGDDVVRVPSSRAQGKNPTCVVYRSADSQSGVVVDLLNGSASGHGADRLHGVRCVEGTPYDDVIVGSPLGDAIDSGSGSDRVFARGGPDGAYSSGGYGGVDPFGGSGSDVLFLGPGADSATGTGGNDRIYGGPGADQVVGVGGSDQVFGGPGADGVHGTHYCDTASSAGTGMGDRSPNEVYGGPGDDEVTGDLAADVINGGPGLDTGYGGPTGRWGADVFISVERPTSCP